MSLQLPEFSGKNISLAVLAYYWGLIGLFRADLPLILTDKLITWATIGSCFWLLFLHFHEDEEDIEDYCRRMSPQLLTEKGTFSWSGITHSTHAGVLSFNIYYGNGCNHDGLVYEGNIAIVCPKDHVVEVGQDRLIRTEFKPRSIPHGMIFRPGTKLVLLGDQVSSCFKNGLDKESAINSAQVEYYTVLSNSYQNGFNRMVDLVHSHAGFNSLHNKIDVAVESLKRIESVAPVIKQVNNPKYDENFDGWSDDGE
ncbi:hypothetical protein [Methanolobus sp. WCC4]|uniref:hypothetical protein n=1 Tax=Methanolobus sp. WCC4 TaxID=3125784 RepID=UPI0030FBDB17